MDSLGSGLGGGVGGISGPSGGIQLPNNHYRNDSQVRLMEFKICPSKSCLIGFCGVLCVVCRLLQLQFNNIRLMKVNLPFQFKSND